jgi:hypothetical protein
LNQTELDESLDDVDMAAVYAMPVAEPAPPGPARKRRKFRRYPKPVCTDAQWQAILAYQPNRCAVCHEEKELYRDHSYRSGKTRGGLCRQCNCMLGMAKDSPTRLKNALAYLKNPPGKALGLCDTEKDGLTRPTAAGREGKQPTTTKETSDPTT